MCSSDLPARLRARVVLHADRAPAESFRHFGITGDQIDVDLPSVNRVQVRNQAVQNAARAAFDQENARELGDVAGEDVAQRTSVREVRRVMLTL